MSFKVRGAPDEPTFDRSTAPEGASWAWSSRLDALKSMACAPLETESRERGALPTAVADACCGPRALGARYAGERASDRDRSIRVGVGGGETERGASEGGGG